MDISALRQRLESSTNKVAARQHAVALFATIVRQLGAKEISSEVQGAVTSALSSPIQVVCQEAVNQLSVLYQRGALKGSTLHGMVLQALPACSICTAGLLAPMLVQLACDLASPNSPATRTTSQASSHSVNTRGSVVDSHVPRWSKHPLTEALLLQPGCGNALISACAAQLRHAAGQKPGAEDTWLALEPFLSYILLKVPAPFISSPAVPDPSSAWSGLQATLAGDLVRLACRYPDVYGEAVLKLLMQRVASTPMASAAFRYRLQHDVSDVIDILQLLQQHTQQAQHVQKVQLAACTFADTLLNQAWHASHASHPGVALPACDTPCFVAVITALATLNRAFPGLLHGRQAHLALLCSCVQGQAYELSLALLHDMQSSKWPSPTSTAHSSSVDETYTTLCAQPMIQGVAYAGNAKTRSWCSYLLRSFAVSLQERSALRDSGLEHDQHKNANVAGPWEADLCLLHACKAVISDLGHASHRDDRSTTDDVITDHQSSGGSAKVLAWLASLKTALEAQKKRQSITRSSARTADPTQQITDVTQQGGLEDLHPVVGQLLCTYLLHTDPSIVQSSISVVHVLLTVQPQSGLQLLPTIMYCLRQTCSSSSNTHHTNDNRTCAVTHANVQAGLLSLFAPLLGNASTAPYAVRVLRTFQAASTPLLLRCMALRLVVESWLTTGSNWAAAEAALMGYNAPGSPDPALPLRLARAGLVVAVCDKDPQKGVELVGACQEALVDDAAQVAALGLRALTRLCDTDLLDFYKAWKVVSKVHPRLPTHPLAAAAWVAFLGSGYLDARAYPDQATALLQGLWAATRHASEQVREAAYNGLCNYPLDVQEELGVLPDLYRLTANITASHDGNAQNETGSFEHSPRVREAASKLAVIALRYEHENRRRFFLEASQGMHTGSAHSAASSHSEAASKLQDKAEADKKPSAHAAVAGADSGGAVPEREVAALKYRLLSVIPASLSSSSVAGKAGKSGGGGAVAVLSTPAAAAAKVLAFKTPSKTALTAAAVQSLVLDAVRSMGNAQSCGLGAVLAVGWEVPVWKSFFAKLPVDILTEAFQQSTAQSKPGLLATLLELAQSGNAAERVAAPLAVAGLCSALPEGVDVDAADVCKKLIALLPDAKCPEDVASLLLAMCHAATHLHVTDDVSRAAVMATLHNLLSTPPAATSGNMDRSRTGFVMRNQEGPSQASTTASLQAAIFQQPVVMDAALRGMTMLACDVAAQADLDQINSMDAEDLVQLTSAHRRVSEAAGISATGSSTHLLATAMYHVISSTCMYDPEVQTLLTSVQDTLHGSLRAAVRLSAQSIDTNTVKSTLCTAALPCLVRLLLAVQKVLPSGSVTHQNADILLSLLRRHVASALSEFAGQGDRNDEAVSDVEQMLSAAGLLFTDNTGSGSSEISDQASPCGMTLNACMQIASQESRDGATRGQAALCLATICSASNHLSNLASQQPFQSQHQESASASAVATDDAGTALDQIILLSVSMAQGLAGVAKGSNCASARTAAALALATLLCGPQATRDLVHDGYTAASGDTQQGQQTHAIQGLLLNPNTNFKQARTCLRTLDNLHRNPTGTAITAGSVDATAAAALALASVCHAYGPTQSTTVRSAGRQESEELDKSENLGADNTQPGVVGSGAQKDKKSTNSGSASGVALQPINRYPATGPLRQLTDVLTTSKQNLTLATASQSTQQQTSMLCVLRCASDALRCLGQAPRLAVFEYGTLLNSVVQHTVQVASTTKSIGSLTLATTACKDNTDACMCEVVSNVQTAAVQLALAHGHEGVTGISSFLATWSQPSKLQTLQITAQCAMLAGLPGLLRSLAPSRAAALLISLPDHIAPDTSACLWHGLRSALRHVKGGAAPPTALSTSRGKASMPVKQSSTTGSTSTNKAVTFVLHEEVSAALYKTIASMYMKLEVPCTLFPGDIAAIKMRVETLFTNTNADMALPAILSSWTSAPYTNANIDNVMYTRLAASARDWIGAHSAPAGVEVWPQAAATLLQIRDLTKLPAGLLDDTLFDADRNISRSSSTAASRTVSIKTGSSTSQQHAASLQLPSDAGSFIAASRCAFTRCLMVLGAAFTSSTAAQASSTRVMGVAVSTALHPVNVSYLAPAKAWLCFEQQATLGVVDRKQFEVVASGMAACAAALASTTPTPQMAQHMATALSSGNVAGLLMCSFMAASCLVQASMHPSMAVETNTAAAVTGGSCSVAGSTEHVGVAGLSYLLPRLLQSTPAWTAQLDTIVDALINLGNTRNLHGVAEVETVVRKVAVACLFALRHGVHQQAVSDAYHVRYEKVEVGCAAALFGGSADLWDRLCACLDTATAS